MTFRFACLALAAAFLALSPTARAEDDFPAPAPAPAPAPEAADDEPADAVSADEAPADDAAEGDADLAVIEDASTGEAMRVDIVGIRSIIGPEPAKALRTVPGSGFTIDRDRLQKSRTVTTLQGYRVKGASDKSYDCFLVAGVQFHYPRAGMHDVCCMTFHLSSTTARAFSAPAGSDTTKHTAKAAHKRIREDF